MICQTALAFGAGNLAILGSHLRRCHASSCDINDDRHSSETLTLAAASAAITARHNKATRASLTVEHLHREALAQIWQREKKIFKLHHHWAIRALLLRLSPSAEAVGNGSSLEGCSVNKADPIRLSHCVRTERRHFACQAASAELVGHARTTGIIPQAEEICSENAEGDKYKTPKKVHRSMALRLLRGNAWNKSAEIRHSSAS